MDKMMRVLLVAVAGTTMVFADTKPEVVSLIDLKQEMIENFMQGKLSNMVVECPAGTVLPLKLSMQGEFLALRSKEEIPAYVKILKTCLVKSAGETFLVSLDGKNWKDFSDFFTGKVGVQFQNSEQGAFVGLSCELNHRS